MKTPKLHTELVPKTCFFTNVRSQVSEEDWDWLRKETYKQANHKCECCQSKGRMEAHEIWHYDDTKNIQKLHAIVCLCNLCHLTMHLGYAEIKGKGKEVREHLSKVNGWTKAETNLYIEAVFEIWFQRSQKNWTLDLTLLDNCNISYSLIDPKDRNKQSLLHIKKT